jgi:hypothetical protein
MMEEVGTAIQKVTLRLEAKAVATQATPSSTQKLAARAVKPAEETTKVANPL